MTMATLSSLTVWMLRPFLMRQVKSATLPATFLLSSSSFPADSAAVFSSSSSQSLLNPASLGCTRACSRSTVVRFLPWRPLSASPSSPFLASTPASLMTPRVRSQHDSRTPRLPSSLTVVKFVPQQEAWVIERMGRFWKVLEPGLNILIPFIDRVKYVQSLKEIAIDIPQQSVITVDNVGLQIDGVLYLKVLDPYKASYGVEDAEFAITQLAQTTMRSEIGKISLDTVFRERESLNTKIIQQINNAAEAWGIDCKRYEIRDITVPARVKEAMQMQVEAERKKRAAILESEGIRESDINVAEGKKAAAILASEGLMAEKVNIAQGEAEAILRMAEARASGLTKVASALQDSNGNNAASFAVAEQYVAAFSNLAKTGNTVLLPSNTGDVASMVTQAMGVYQTLRIPTTRNNSSSANMEEDEEEEGHMTFKHYD